MLRAKATKLPAFLDWTSERKRTMPIYICWYKSASLTHYVPTEEVIRALWSNEVTEKQKKAAQGWIAAYRNKGWVEVEE